MNCEAVDCDTSARACRCFRHTPTSAAGTSCGGNDSGSLSQPRIASRVGCPSALNSTTRSSSVSSATPSEYRSIAICRSCGTPYIVKSRYGDGGGVMTKTALVVGARGVIGGNLVRHLERVGGWD